MTSSWSCDCIVLTPQPPPLQKKNKTMLKLGGTTLNGGEGRGRWVLYLTDAWLAAIWSKNGFFFCQCFIMLASNVNKISLHTFGCFCKGETRTKQDYNCSWPKGGHVGSLEQKHFPPLFHREYLPPPGDLALLGLNPLNPKIKIWLLVCCPQFISYRSSGEKLIKYQPNSSCVIMSVLLMTTLFYKALILQGEIWCWSLLGLKGSKG